MRCTSVAPPSATRPARIREALALKSVAMTGAESSFFPAPYQCLVSVDFNVGTEPPEFTHMDETVFKYRFSEHAPSFGNAHECHELGLKIRGKPRKRHGLDIDAFNGFWDLERK